MLRSRFPFLAASASSLLGRATATASTWKSSSTMLLSPLLFAPKRIISDDNAGSSSSSPAAATSNSDSTSATTTQQQQQHPKRKRKKSASSRATPRIEQDKKDSTANTSSSSNKNAPKIRVGVLQPHAEGTWADDSVRCSPEIYASDKLQQRYSFQDVVIRKNSAFRQLRQLTSENKFDVYWNLCDGARDEVRPGEDTLRVLESLNAGFTGADSLVFEPSKIEMKMLLAGAGIRTPNFAVLDRSDVESDEDAREMCSHLRFPVIVKHISGYGSIGITKDSKCDNMDKLVKKLKSFVLEYDVALVEEFIVGEEGTVFVCADPSNARTGLHVFEPLMIPIAGGGADFLHYGNKWKSSLLEGVQFNFFLKPDGSRMLPSEAEAQAKLKKLLKKKARQSNSAAAVANSSSSSLQGDASSSSATGSDSAATSTANLTPAEKKKLKKQQREAEEEARLRNITLLTNEQRAAMYRKVQRMAANAFIHIMQRVGYGRCDFRIDAATGEPYFLEINPNCGIFLPDAKTGKPAPGEGDYADLMIAEDKNWGHDRFIRTQLEIALQHNKARTPWWCHSYSAAAGSFITKATRFVPKFTRIFGDEVRPVPVVARTVFDATVVDERAIAAGNSNSHRNTQWLSEEIDEQEEADEDDSGAGNNSNNGGNGNNNSIDAGGKAGGGRNSSIHRNMEILVSPDALSVEGKKIRRKMKLGQFKVGCAIFRGDGMQSCVMLQHSCDPNCALVHSSTLELATIKPIKKGEPLTLDYATARDPAMPAFRCSCDEPNCRGWIHSQPVNIRRELTSSSSSSAAAAAPSSNVKAQQQQLAIAAPVDNSNDTPAEEKVTKKKMKLLKKQQKRLERLARTQRLQEEVEQRQNRALARAARQQEQQEEEDEHEAADEKNDEGSSNNGKSPAAKDSNPSIAALRLNKSDAIKIPTGNKSKPIVDTLNTRAVGLASAPVPADIVAGGADGTETPPRKLEIDIAKRISRELARKSKLLMLQRAKLQKLKEQRKKDKNSSAGGGKEDDGTSGVAQIIRDKVLATRKEIDGGKKK